MTLPVANSVRLGFITTLLGTALVGQAQVPTRSPTIPNQENSVRQESSLPDSPGTIRYEAQNNQAAATGTIQSAVSPTQATPQKSPGQTPQNANPAPQKPVGTAAAEAPNVTAVAASQPAGIAMAPPKQHRVRTIVLKTGAIIGAGVAIGAVVALTSATPSKPPGAH
jgi:cytoskeletal protein RodZ